MEDLPQAPPLPPSEPVPTPRSHPSAFAVAILLCVALLLLFLVPGLIAQFLHPSFGIWFTEVFLFLGVSWVVMRLSGRDPVRYPRLSFPGIQLCLLGFLVGTINFFAVVVPVQSFFQWLSPKWLQELYDQSQIFKNQTPVELALIVGAVSLAAPVCEEYFFRGIFQQGLMRTPERPWPALLISAAVFSAFHLDPIGFAARFELGLLFGYLLYRTGSLWPGIMAHAANNFVSTVLYFALKDVTGADEDPNPLVLVGMALVLTPVLLLVVRYVSRQQAPVPEPRDLPLLSFPRLALPWVASALVAILLLVGVDRRGVALNVYDATISLPSESKTPIPEELRVRAHLRDVRDDARAGRVPLKHYADERRYTAERLQQLGKLPRPPEPLIVPPTTGPRPTPTR